DLDLEATLRRITEAAVTLVDARYGALGVLDESGNALAEFITVGVDEQTHRAIGALPKGLGLLGAIITDAASRRVADLTEDPDRAGFPPGHPPMQSFLGVPIRIGDRVFGNLYLTDKTSAEVFTDIDQELVEGLAGAAAIAIENARLHTETRRRQDTLVAFEGVARTLLGGADRDELLGEVARRARDLAGADLAAIVVPTGDRDELRVELAVGAGADALLATTFARGTSVSGHVLATGDRVAVDDLAEDPRTGPFQARGDLGAAVFVPFEADDAPFGTLVVARRRGRPRFAAFERDIVSSFAGQVSLVLHHERQRSRLRDLAILEDRDRIARDLHDTVIQGVFATSLTLQGAARLVDEPTARARLDDAVDRLDEIVRHIRTVIFGIESPRRGDDGMRLRALAVSQEAARALGAEPRVTFEGAVDTLVVDALADDLVAALREALSNVARHARASTTDVTVSADETAVVLVVRDDGVGIGPHPRRGQGTRNLEERAARHGGTVEVGPGPAGGTQVTWRAPLGR
ncbi:MAG: GAF domain-containing protein, partial [Acidimicrobiales bacterium]|nr:GAF domain-containing protein [Acidimicrobiales bacterium]